MNKIIKNKYLSFIFLAGILIIFCVNRKQNYDIEKDTDPYSLMKEETYWKVFQNISLKGNDWSVLPLSKKFRQKYNSNDSIFPNENYNQCDIFDFFEKDFDKNKLKGDVTIILYNTDPQATHFAKLNEVYRTMSYTLNKKYELDTIEFKNEIKTTNEKGELIHHKIEEMTEDNYAGNIQGLLFFEKNHDYAGVFVDYSVDDYPWSESFYNKVVIPGKNRYIDFFYGLDYDYGLIFKDIHTFDEHKLECVLVKENWITDGKGKEICRNKYYWITAEFTLNEKNELDDINIVDNGEISEDKFKSIQDLDFERYKNGKGKEVYDEIKKNKKKR